MNLYKHIIVAVDLSDDAELVLEKAQVLARASDAMLTLVHVVQPLSVTYYSMPMDLASLNEQISEKSRDRMSELFSNIQWERKEQMIVYGCPEKEIHKIVREKNIDLIIVGSHGKDGLALIFGSTSSSIFHGASCDVLAMRVGK